MQDTIFPTPVSTDAWSLPLAGTAKMLMATTWLFRPFFGWILVIWNRFCWKEEFIYIKWWDLPRHWDTYYSIGVQIVSCTLSSDSVLSESTGSFNSVISVLVNEISFDKKISQSVCVFQLTLGLEEHYSPSPLGDLNGLLWRPIGVLFKLWHLNMIYF